jgi:uncharacterized repeat protein (TIGR03803 family)
MTNAGGASGFGTIFSLPVTGGSLTLLCSFTGNGGACPGAKPNGSLTFSGSTMYGMTSAGGAKGDGLVFSLPSTGGTPNILCSFTGNGGACPGANPNGSLTFSGSTLYGMTSAGGANGDGLVFSLPITGGTPNILCSFNYTNGGEPAGDLTLIGSSLYGLTEIGGANGNGTIFSLPVGGGTPTILFSFDGVHGSNPMGSLTLSGSTLYGMTEFGGVGFTPPLNNLYGGTVFSLPVTLPYTVTVNQTTGGAVTVSPSQVTYNTNDTPAVTATASPGYFFNGWSVSGGTVSPSASQAVLTVQGNVILSAVFALSNYSGTETGTGGTIILSNSGPYIYGQVITVTASVQHGYIFSGWSVTGPSTLSNSAALSTSLTVYDNFTLTATFVVRPLGDINSDGKVDGNDLTILNNRLNGFAITPQTDADCDLNDDGHVTTADRVLLRKILNGLPVP